MLLQKNDNDHDGDDDGDDKDDDGDDTVMTMIMTGCVFKSVVSNWIFDVLSSTQGHLMMSLVQDPSGSYLVLKVRSHLSQECFFSSLCRWRTWLCRLLRLWNPEPQTSHTNGVFSACVRLWSWHITEHDTAFGTCTKSLSSAMIFADGDDKRKWVIIMVAEAFFSCARTVGEDLINNSLPVLFVVFFLSGDRLAHTNSTP